MEDDTRRGKYANARQCKILFRNWCAINELISIYQKLLNFSFNISGFLAIPVEPFHEFARCFAFRSEYFLWFFSINILQNKNKI